MSGKNGGIRQIYNLIDGRDCGSESGEWFHVLRTGSDKSVLCAAPRSTMKDVEEARNAAMAVSDRLFEEIFTAFFPMIVEEIDGGKIVLADAAADESGLDKYEILEELEKVKSLPTSWGYKLNNPEVCSPVNRGGNLKIISVGGSFEIKPMFFSTVMFSVLYELLNGSAVILLPSRANEFCYYFGKMISNAVKSVNLPSGIFGLIYAKDGKLADDVLGEMLGGKFYKVGNGIVVPKRK